MLLEILPYYIALAMLTFTVMARDCGKPEVIEQIGNPREDPITFTVAALIAAAIWPMWWAFRHGRGRRYWTAIRTLYRRFIDDALTGLR